MVFFMGSERLVESLCHCEKKTVKSVSSEGKTDSMTRSGNPTGD